MTNSRRISSAHVLAAIAIFIALGGSALAISAQSIKSKHVRDNSLQGRDVRDGALTGADLADGSLAGSKLAANALTGDQINEATLKLDLPAPPSSGAPTGPASGDLTGTYPAPLIAAGAVGGPELADNSVTGSELAAGSVGTSELAAGGVGTQAVAAEALTRDDLGANSVESSELGSSSVSSSELAANSVFGGEIADGTLDGDDVGHDSGSFTMDPPEVEANKCATFTADTGTDTNLSGDAILITPEFGSFNTVSVEALAGLPDGAIRLQVCSYGSQATSDAGLITVRWIAFDV